MEDLAETPSNCQSSRFENEVLVLTVKKYKLLIYYFLCVKLEKLTNSVSDKKKKSLLAKPWECEIGTNLRGRNQYTRSDGRFTEINAGPGELFASSQYTHAHKKHFRVYFGLPLWRR